MFKKQLEKSDGRKLILYSERAFSGDENFLAPSPNQIALSVNPQMRWHPFRGEWVIYADHRQNRTFMPPKEFNPLKPSDSNEFPTELPKGNYQIAVFENLFPALKTGSKAETPATGACEVVVYTQDPDQKLGHLSLSTVELLIRVWKDRTEELGKREEIAYVMPFENRGVEVGVTLQHPHGQIYAYSFIPPVPAKILAEQKKYFEAKGRGLLFDVIAEEREFKKRVIFENETAIAFMPAFARYTYEVWIAPKAAKPSLLDLSDQEIKDLASALKRIVQIYDGLWNQTFPYLMVLQQAPTDGKTYPEAHIHFEFYPAYRAKDRLKYLAGTELGAGTFANDSLPEQKAEELRAVKI